MIHQLLNITRPLFVLDTETTGVDPRTDRIVELSFQRWSALGMTKEWRTLVNPGIPIPAVVTKVHGITDERVKRCNKCNCEEDQHPVPIEEGPCYKFYLVPTFKQLAANLATGFTDCDFAGKNIRFDLRILAAEMARAGQAWDYATARIVDAERLEQLAIPRSLSHLHKKYTGAEHDGAHGALSDVRASTTVIVKQLEAHATLPRDLDALHEAQWPGWLDGDGSFRLVDGVATCMFGRHKGVAMRSIPTSYYDWILKSEFSPDVKKLASAVKLGRFPEEKR